MIYIGKTTQGTHRRWIHHVAEARKDHKEGGWSAYLHRAIIKYGRENFSIEVIEEVPLDQMNEREIYWIEFYHSNDKSIGYNLTYGGEGTVRVNYQQVYDYWDEGKSSFEISKIMGHGRATIGSILSQYENYSQKEERLRRGRNISKAKGTPVSQYDVQGNFIATYESSMAAERAGVGVGRGAIKRCCDKGNTIAGGYQWRYAFDPPPGPFTDFAKGKRKPIIQKDMNGNIVAVYSSLTEAKEATGIDTSSICSCCRGDYHTAGGYKWEYGYKVKED